MEKQTVVGRAVLIFVVVGLAVLAFLTKGLTLGQDLKGGTTVRFALDVEQARAENRIEPGETEAQVVANTIEVIESRIDKWGLAELSVVPLGKDTFEISLPAEVDPESIIGLVTSLGDLQFRIEVKPTYEQSQGDDSPPPARQDVWKGATGADAKSYPATPEGFEEFKKDEIQRWKTAREQATRYVPMDPRYRLVREADTDSFDPSVFHVLEEPAESRFRFGGKMLSSPQVGQHPTSGQPVVLFGIKAEYQNDFETWTTQSVGLPMATVLNDEHRIAPTIHEPLSDNVQVTLGRRGTRAQLENEAKQLVTVLQTGAIRLKPRKESQSTVGPSLAGEAVRRGVISTVVALALVLAFMLGFYLWAGLVADLALILNLVLLLGAMAFFGATLTLPGIAGIVLTLGMAVDANILIFERIREEQNAGRSVPRAIAEGYDRAFTTIVDSNVTTFITAIFLYAFGTGSIKGFAVSLTLGLMASMFTAIYVTRTVFEARLLRGNTKPIKMSGTGKVPSIGWMALRSRLVPVSLILILGSLGLFFALPDDVVYDIDFTGGLKLQTRFNRATSVDDVQRALGGGKREVTIAREAAVGEEAGSGPATKTVQVGPYDAQVVTVGTGGDWVEIKVPGRDGTEGVDLSESERLAALKAYTRIALGDRLVPEWLREGPVTYAKVDDADPKKAYDGRLRVRVALEDPAGVLTPEVLDRVLTEVMPHYVYGMGTKRERYPPTVVQREIVVESVPTPGVTKEKTYDVFWKADKAGAPTEVDAVRLRQELREFFASAQFRDAVGSRTAPGASAGAADVTLSDPFPVDDVIGQGVAKRQRNDAVVALLLSLVGIVLYVAFRFRSYPMGFSAILCLFHDVVIALGAVCLVNMLGLVDAKINLGLVAAFLTIVGFSVNDTVVTFDRIRELRGKATRITSKMIDDAVNQTLSRTWRTSATALITVVVLFVANVGQRSMLEGLSFTLIVGMIAGVYSTIAIAAPLLLFLPWFWARVKAYRPRLDAITWPLRAPGVWVLLGIVVATAVVAYAVRGLSVQRTAVLALFVAPVAVTVGLWLAWLAAFVAGAFVWGFLSLFAWTSKPDPEQLVRST